MIRAFCADTGQTLWSRIETRLQRIGFPLPDTEVRNPQRCGDLIEFLVTAAWGYNHVSDEAYRSRAPRFSYLWEGNPNIYRLFVDQDRELSFHVQFGNDDHMVNLGHLWGFTAVMPLTDIGYGVYIRNEKPASSLTFENKEICRVGEDAQSAAALITGAVYFPCLHRLLKPPPRRLDFAYCANELLVGLFEHLAIFLPRASVRDDDDGRRAELHDRNTTCPLILSFTTGEGLGEPELRAAGFAEVGVDFMGNKKWVFNPDDVNDPEICPRRRKKMLRMVELMDLIRGEDD